MSTSDKLNNVGRSCSLPGDAVSRKWVVLAEAAGGGYMLRHAETGEVRVAELKKMHSLY